MGAFQRTAAFLAILLLLAGCATPLLGMPPPFDHYDPAKLRAAALEREAAGDTSTATVLRARANRLVPHEMRAASGSPPAAAPPTSAASQAPLPEPPALWPAK